MSDNQKVRVAIIGVGNCASALIQGVHYYQDTPEDERIPGLMHVNLGGYHVRDIQFTAAFDVVDGKVGCDLSEAIAAYPNNTYKFSDVPQMDVPVSRGMTHDGLGKYLSQILKKAPGPTADIVGILKDTKTDVVVNFLPVGSEMATKWYVEQILEAGCAFVNGIPVFIASSEYWGKRFKDAGLPIIGDDVKSQVGATILHRSLTSLFVDRGVRLDRTYQLNFGGNTDFLNMLERERLEFEKDLQNRGGHLDAAVSNRTGRRARRSQRLRPLADRPQMVLRAHGRHHLRRCAAQPGSQAGSVGLAQLRRGYHRRGALRQAGAGPRPCRTHHRAFVLLHEDAAQAVPR